jgi:hypothetical protein
LKDGRTHLAYKPEHAMDLDTGALPLFLGVVDTATGTLLIYHIAPRFYAWGLGDLQNG